MTDKEKILIDGVEYNPCNGCKLWNGHHCTGARSYEPNTDEHRAICNEHMANQFHKVYQQLYSKTAECEELKRKVELMMDCPDCKVDEYKKALDEIKYQTTELYIGVENKDRPYCEKILDIVNKVKDGE